MKGKECEIYVIKDQVLLPNLGERNIRQAVTVIPEEYWGLNCWKYHQERHSTFSCPYFTAEQRLLFVYRYQIHQVRANPQMNIYIDQKLKWRMKKDHQKRTVVDQFVGERTRSLGGNRAGYGRVNAGVPSSRLQCKHRGRGRTPYRREKFHVAKKVC